ncbi:hypothetical protein [Parasphingorhabdus sp.]|uniref:hypothetical protein n=1 Tax=Parasphingorhabdus sp. TaxID=2709688 RepID=UPI003262D1B1
MIEAKILFLMFVWPVGQAEDRPRWTTEAFVTIESCEEAAMIWKDKSVAEYGSETRVEYYCFHADDRMSK